MLDDLELDDFTNILENQIEGLNETEQTRWCSKLWEFCNPLKNEDDLTCNVDKLATSLKNKSVYCLSPEILTCPYKYAAQSNCENFRFNIKGNTWVQRVNTSWLLIKTKVKPIKRLTILNDTETAKSVLNGFMCGYGVLITAAGIVDAKCANNVPSKTLFYTGAGFGAAGTVSSVMALVSSVAGLSYIGVTANAVSTLLYAQARKTNNMADNKQFEGLLDGIEF